MSLAFAFATRVESASALSDRMVITDIATGTLLFNQTSDEGAAGAESALVFATGGPNNWLESFVILLEPAGEPPGENPVFLPGSDRIVSDLVVFGPNSSVVFNSDGDPNFQGNLSGVLASGIPPHILDETGDLQDLTALLGSNAAGWQMQVQSDVVPEPGTFALLGFGLLGLGAAGRRGWRD